MRNVPLISCLCLSYKRPEMLNNAIECFLAQTYPKKELVIIGHHDDEASRLIIQQYKDEQIKFFEVPKMPVGSLRNISIEKSSGDYFCLWDDDDYHHNKRLEEQMNQMKINGKEASALVYCLLHDRPNGSTYLSFAYLWPQTLMCRRDFYDFGIQYDSVDNAEDLNFMLKLHALNCICPVVTPYLYTFVYTGKNVRQYDFFRQLFKKSQPISSRGSGIVSKVLCNGHSKEMASRMLSDEQLTAEFNFFHNMNEREILFEQHDDVLAMLDERVVLNGHFKGLKYPGYTAIGSSILPKLVGSYEHELWQVVEEIIRGGYTEIINIGCGEGYYANGLALRMQEANVYAYDTDGDARELCLAMSVLNGISDRVHVGNFFTADTLKSFRFTKKSLIICDCEGYELDLFTEDTKAHLTNSDLLIETHDFINIDISTRLTDLFRDTHHIACVQSIDDLQKAKHYSFPPFETITDLKKRRYIYAEGRPAIMEWLWLKSLNGYKSYGNQ